MVGIITQICQMNGVTGHPTDVFMTCGRQVGPNTLEKFSRRPRPQAELAVREPGQEEQEEEEINLDDEEPPLDQPQQQQMPPPQMPRADPWIDQRLGHIVLQNEFLIDAMRHQFKVNAHINNYHVGLVEDINAMVARLNIEEPVRRPADLP